MAAAVDYAVPEGDVPLIVCVLAGNPATSAAVLACLNTVDASRLRQLHTAVAGVVAGVPWCDTDTRVVDTVRWRAGLPAAVGVRLAGRAVECLLASDLAVAALSCVTHLDLRDRNEVTDDMILRLPASLFTLIVRSCGKLTAGASFTHLRALASLDCTETRVVSERTDGLPPSLQELDITNRMRTLRPGASLLHLCQLRVLRANWSRLGDATLASLPPCLKELHAAHCRELTPAASFAHLTSLRKLDVAHSLIGDASLATVPMCLVVLNARRCDDLTPAAVLPHLPALQLLDVSGTPIGDALVATLPATLVELRMAGCRNVTAGATLDHLRALRLLHCIDTELAPTALAASRERGCAVPAASVLRGHEHSVTALTVLGDGRLASGDWGGWVRLWNVGDPPAVLRAIFTARGLAALPDGRRLAVGATSWGGDEGWIEVWDVGVVPPRQSASIVCPCGVEALAVLHDGRLAAGCGNTVRVVDGDAGAVVARLPVAGHTGRVMALAVLPDGTLASGSDDASVRVWDVGARSCVATLEGHTQPVTCLTVLVDGRLVSTGTGIGGDAVRLWDVATRTCVAVLARRTDWAAAVAALPDGRLATASTDDAIRLWDTRLAVAASASHAASVVPVEDVGLLGGVESLLPLPDGRLACGGGTGSMEAGAVYLLELPQPPAAYE